MEKGIKAFILTIICLGLIFPVASLIEHDFRYEYSGISATVNSTFTFLFDVENTGTDTRKLETKIKNVSGFFGSTGSSSVTYSLAGGESKTFRITITPDEVGEKELWVVTQDRNLLTNTTTKIPVYIKRNPNSYTEREVPGIGLHQVVFILAVSCLYLYYSRP